MVGDRFNLFYPSSRWGVELRPDLSEFSRKGSKIFIRRNNFIFNQMQQPFTLNLYPVAHEGTFREIVAEGLGLFHVSPIQRRQGFQLAKPKTFL